MGDWNKFLIANLLPTIIDIMRYRLHTDAAHAVLLYLARATRYSDFAKRFLEVIF